MGKGDMVRWDSGGLLPTYGVILSITEEVARVEFRDNQTSEYKVISKNISELVKIGSK